ncbi:MAG: choice-of-anchor K domain-containing protein [Candidatus Shapirobacteria bacterium]
MHLKKYFQNVCAISCNFSLLLNSFLPYFAVIPAYAEEPTPTPIVESTPAPVADPTIAPTDAPVEPTVVPTIAPTETPVEPTAVPTAILTEAPTITPVITETPTVTPVVTPVVTEEPTITPEVTITPIDSPEPTAPAVTSAPSENNNNNNQSSGDNSNSATPTSTPDSSPVVPTPSFMVPSPTPTPSTRVVEQVCPVEGDTMRDSVELDWNYDCATDTYITREKVQLGIKYIFPKENNVTVTFTSLPKDELYRSYLKIKQVKTSELKLPENVGNIGEYAYDITTDMFDGEFKYDITLPKNPDQTAEISYIEKTLEQAKTGVTTSEINSVDESKTEQQDNKIVATNIDHFTIFLVINPDETLDENNVLNPNNGWISDNLYAEFDHRNDSAEYGFPNTGVPTGATIEGIEVYVEGLTTGRDFDISLWNQSDGSDEYTSSKTADLNSSETTVTLGSSTEKWGKTWTPADFDTNFKVVVDANSSISGDTAKLDMVKVKVYFSTPITPPTLPNNPSDTYALNSVSGIWTSISGGSNYQGLNTSEIRWGSPSGAQKSGLRFTNSGLQSFNQNQIFYLGMLTHMNWGTYAGTAANGATLQVTLDFNRPNITDPVFTYDFDIEETANSLGQCLPYQLSNTPCDDKVTFPNSYGSQVFTIGDTQYTLVINGFVNAFPSGSALSAFVTEEQRDNSAFLVGHLSSVLVERPNISIVKKTNGQDITSAPGQNLNIGDTVNWTYIIQNSGNVNLTGISIVDNPVATITCPGNSLASGASMICTASGIVQSGQFTNTATVTASYVGGSVNATDKSYYFGVNTARCGDGIKNQAIEECDDGNSVNTDTCLDTCVTPTCGDGYLWIGNEQCDIGSSNTNTACTASYNSTCNYCDTTCVPHTITGPRCGDGIINGTETCDGTNLGGLSSTDFQCNSCSLELIESKIDICHASDSHSNPYIVNQPNKSGDVSGHANHTGPIWYPGITVSWGDIIPPFAYIGGTFPGLNWTTEGQAIYNNDCNLPKGTLIVNKVLTNDNGGTKVFSNFSFNIGATTYIFDSDGQNDLSVTPGKYTITENTAVGYTTTYNNCSNITVPVSGSATCTITNDDIAPSLTLNKILIKDNGSTALESAWTLTANGGSAGILSGPGAAGSTDVVSGLSFKAGTYTLSESSSLSGYTASAWTCTNGITVNGNSEITLNIGQSTVCSITNNDIQPKLTVTKIVVGDSKPASEFTLKVGATTVLTGVQNGFNVGNYVVSEYDNTGANFPNYNKTITGDCASNGAITLAPGDVKSCIITNTRKTGTLRVLKNVDLNGDGDYTDAGETGATDWQWQTSWLGVPEYDHSGKTGDTAVTVVNGNHFISETPKANFHQVSISCIGDLYEGDSASGHTVGIGENANVVCTFVNARDTGNLIVKKVVINDNGGVKTASDFKYSINGGTEVSFEADGQNDNKVITGSYSVTEPNVAGYTTTYDNCTNVTVSKDVITTCTITNDDIAPTLKLNKIVINGVGATKVAGDWTLSAVGTSGFSDFGNSSTFHNVKAGVVYSLGESGPIGYSSSWWKCDKGEASGNTVKLSLGENATCTITNTQLGKIIIEKQTLPDKTSGSFEFYSSWGDGNFFLTDGQQKESWLIAGTYSFNEIVPPGWVLTDKTCTSSIGDTETYGNLELDSGETITCVFTNTKIASPLYVSKFEDLNGNQTIEESERFLDGWTFELYENNTCTGSPSMTAITNGDLGKPGTASFENLYLGQTYWIKEVKQDGWTLTTGNCQSYTMHVDNESNNQMYFGNQPEGSIHGYKWSDADGSGGPVSSFNEELLPGWTINLYKSNNAGGYEPTPIKTMNTDIGTSHFGWYWFENLLPGQYKVCEVLQDGWRPIYPTTDKDDNCHLISLPDGNSGQFPNSTNYVSGHEYNFGNQQLGQINVTKFNDIDNDGKYNEDIDKVLPGWIVNLSGDTKITGNKGAIFDQLTPSTYTLSEVMQDGWTQTGITCSSDSRPTPTVTQTPTTGPTQAPQCKHENAECQINNSEKSCCSGLVCVTGNNPSGNGHCQQPTATPTQGNCSDIDRDEICDSEDNCPSVANASQTDSNGDGTGDACEAAFKFVKSVSAQADSDSYNHKLVTVKAGDNIQCFIGNRLVTPTATISKTNDAVGDLSPGSSVGYKIKVKILGNDVTGFKVTDLLSNGFKYRLGSYHVSIGGTDVTGSIIEPQYHSPGVWNLGDLKAGDVVELSYIADISTDQQPGEYTDLAVAMGNAKYQSSTVYAQGEDSQYVNTTFVGTIVPVVKSTQNSIGAGVERQEIRTGEVLGASTELPSTGSSTSWLIISTLMSLLGFTLIKKSKKVLSILLFAAFFLFPNNATAVGNLSVRLEIPKSPINTNDVNLNFVALDIDQNFVIVKCFKKYSTDATFTQFGADISSPNAGYNANHCSLSSVLSTEGSYEFKVMANGVDSNTVSMEYKVSGPGTPNDYRKDHPNNCDYKIHFKTADDGGKTVKVEVYRADITNFILDAGSVVSTVSVGSNEERDVTNSVPDCNKNYYYVIRAFDNAGNGSSPVGDSVVTSITTTTTIGTTINTDTGAIPVTNVALAPGQENTNDTGTLGAAETTGEGSVLGVQGAAKNFIQKYWLYLILALVIIVLIIRYVSEKKKSTRRK